MAALALFVGTSANAGNVVDELTNATIGVSGNTYQETTGITVSSDAVYSAQSAGGNNAIQLRSNNSNSGIVTTASGGKLVSVTIAFNSNTNAQRVVSIYGKNEAYSAPSDLYGEATQGDLLGEVGMSDENMTVTVEGDYTFLDCAQRAVLSTSTRLL